MNTALSFFLLLLKQLAPVILKDAGATSTVVQTLIAMVPLLIQEAHDLLPMVQNVINALSKPGGVTDDDLALLETLNDQIDAAFDAALRRKVAEGNANG